VPKGEDLVNAPIGRRKQIACVLVIAFTGFAIAAPARAQTPAPSPPANATANLRDGHGDCGESNGNGGFANGTGAFVSTTVQASVARRDTTMGVTFLGINGPVFDPVAGPVEDARAELHGRNDPNDEDYTLELDVNDQSTYTGTFTRVAHFVGAGNGSPRCTATWDVTIDLTGPLLTELPAAAVTTLPRTQERPTTTASSSPSSASGARSSSGESTTTVVALAALAVVLTSLAALALVTRSRRRKPGCDCACTVVITGPATLSVVRASDFTWRVDQSAPMVQGAPDVKVIATYKERDVYSETYAVDLRLECVGEGRLLSSWVEWSIATVGADLVVTAVVDGRVTCAEGGVVDVHCEGSISLGFSEARCGPDLTDQLLDALNRIIERLRNFERMAGSPSHRTFYGVWFLADNGSKMAYFPQGIGDVTPPCPNCPECTTTMSILETCVAGHFAGDLIFGICAGYWDVPQFIQELGGHAAENVLYGKLGLPKLELPRVHLTHELGVVGEWGNLRLNFDSPWSEKVYEVGAQAGRRAYESATYRMTRQNLQQFVSSVPHSACTPCSEHGTIEVIGDDFSTVEWVVPGGRAVPPTWGE
jgi:hypothetical protein